MKYKVSELEGALLDAAVAKAEQRPYRIESRGDRDVCRATESVYDSAWICEH